jgi:hypothetical protein
MWVVASTVNGNGTSPSESNACDRALQDRYARYQHGTGSPYAFVPLPVFGGRYLK